MCGGVWSLHVAPAGSLPFGALQAHGILDTAPSRDQHSRGCWAATVTTYIQVQVPAQPTRGSQSFKLRGFGLHIAFASNECNSGQFLVQTGRNHMP